MDRCNLYLVLCIFLWIHFIKCLGSEVKLAATPSTITNGLTESLKLKCSLQDTVGVSSVIVGRQVSGTDYDIEHVNSIIISKVNPDATVTSLAQIIISENANVLGNSPLLTAVGTLTPSDPADHEYLELFWTNPGEDQSGSYICEVNGLDLQGHSVTLQQSLAVNSIDPKVEDLLKEFNNMKATLNHVEAILATLKAPHNEEGVVKCGDSRFWGEPLYRKVLIVTFQQPYESIPTINIAPVYQNNYSDLNYPEHWQIYLEDVKTTGFKIVCQGFESAPRIVRLDVRWTSVVA